MARNITFRYSLLKDLETWYYRQGNVVLTSITERFVRYAPANWKDTKLGFIRNVKYWGVFREYSVPLQFVKDSAWILREIFYSEGFEGNCILKIEKWNTTQQRFDPFYTGDLNFATTSDERNRVVVSVVDRGLPEMLKTREDIVYEIPMDDPDAVSVSIDGVKVKGDGTWYPGNYSADALNGLRTSAVPWTSGAATVVGGRSLTLHGGDAIHQIAQFIRPHDQYGATGNAKAIVQVALTPGSPDHNDGDYILYANTDLSDIIIDGFMLYDIQIPDVGGTKNVTVRAFVVDTALAMPAAIVASYVIHTATTTLQNTNFPVSCKMDFTIPSIYGGCFLMIAIDGTAAALPSPVSTTAYFPIERGYFKVSFLAKVSPTVSKGFRVIDVCKKLIEKLTEGQYSAISNYLSNQDVSLAFRKSRWDKSAYNTIIMPGDSVRGLPNPIMKISLQQLYSFLWGSELLAMFIKDDGVHFEYLRDVFTEDVIDTVGFKNINDVIVTNYTEVLANSFKVGYEAIDNDNVVGKNEFNNSFVFLNTSILRIKKENNAMSQINFGVYAIESARAKNLDETDKDYKTDNTLFGIEVDPTPVSGLYVPYRPSPRYVAGVDDPDNIYNVEHSPYRLLGTQLPFIRSIKNSGNLVFQTTEKNPELVSDSYSATPTADTLTEVETIPLAADVFKGRDVSRIFAPYVISMDAVTSKNLYNLALSNPYGLITFESKGTTFKGWILDCGISPATNDTYPVKLLSHPSNDLKLLKH